MNEQTKELAEQAGFGYDDLEIDRTMMMIIERFAELIRQNEREDCAKIAAFAGMYCIAKAIKARSKE